MAELPSEISKCPLWDFAVWLYGQDAVSDACLSLQERRKVDVSLFLSCIWAGRSGYATLNIDILSQALEISSKWQGNVVKPLREVRGYLKTEVNGNADIQALRHSILAEELNAERLEIKDLECLISNISKSKLISVDRMTNAAENIVRYFRLNASRDLFNEADLDDIRISLNAAFSSETEFPAWLGSLNLLNAHVQS